MSTTRVQMGNGQVHLAKRASALRELAWPNCRNPHRGYGHKARYGFVPNDTAIACPLCQHAESA
jgi:hypothetical protein